jgi:hypothetical protein
MGDDEFCVISGNQLNSFFITQEINDLIGQLMIVITFMILNVIFLDVKISKKVAQSAALSVINSHRCPATGETVPVSQPCSFTVSEEKKVEVLQSLATHRGIIQNRFIWGVNVPLKE